ncbi:MAG: sugar phosphate isomerase/epimerase [Flavobacteriaceae bacterium]|nr:sugar phosphate isomerase/epimerase [Flavobacteriaceae bacterium]
MNSRRIFLEYSALTAGMLLLPGGLLQLGCTSKISHIKISLAQWSLHRALAKGDVKADDFPFIAKNTYGINAVEYVNQFFTEKATDESYWLDLKRRCDDEGIISLLIMVDDEGHLGNPNSGERIKAVEKHYKWVHAAKMLGCHSIRVNAFGQGSKAAIRSALVDGMGRLAEYAASEEINILIENHGLQSSDGAYIAGIIQEVDNPYLGTLPDFGNWCLNAEWGSTNNNACTEIYDPYQGLMDFMPYAKGVSAKSYDFDADGNETTINYPKLLQLVKDQGYDGYIGIEYEGSRLSESEGIMATKELLERTWATLS